MVASLHDMKLAILLWVPSFDHLSGVSQFGSHSPSSSSCLVLNGNSRGIPHFERTPYHISSFHIPNSNQRARCNAVPGGFLHSWQIFEALTEVWLRRNWGCDIMGYITIYIYITIITATNHTSLGRVRKWGISPIRVLPFKREHDDTPMVFGGQYFQTNSYLCTYFDRHWFYYFFESLLQGIRVLWGTRLVLPGLPDVTMCSIFTRLSCLKKPTFWGLFDPYGTSSTHLTPIMSQNETCSKVESPEMDGLIPRIYQQVPPSHHWFQY